MKRYITAMTLILVSCMLFSVMLLDVPKDKSAWIESTRIIVIDAGHGGIDGGAQGLSGLLEKDVNLSVAKKCELLYPLFGIQTIMTRNDDHSIDDGTGSTIAARKADDIHRRVQIANESGGILISIHMNSFSDPKYYGAQCFYSKVNTSSIFLGKNLQESLRVVNPKNERIEKEAYDSIYIMNHVDIPAVIVECGFLSNPQEELLLSQESYQKKLALSICGGAIRYFSGIS